MKKIFVAVFALVAWVSAGFGGIGVNWTAGGRIYGHDGEEGVAAHTEIVWQLVYAGANGKADAVDSEAPDWVGGDDVVLATRVVPAGGGVASDGTEWDASLAKVDGDSVYEDAGWTVGNGYVYQRIYQGTPEEGSWYFQSGLFAVNGAYSVGELGFPDMFGAAAGLEGGVARMDQKIPLVPKVTDVVARQRYPWNGLVDISCTVTGIEGEAEGLKFSVAAVEESGKVRRGTHVRMVRDGAESEDLEVRENGAYELVWDARADLGAGLWSNVVLRVTFDAHNGVQLWEGGPYWAETNIGAEEPWEYGLYFWWGDTVGYKREGSAWVASDGSAENFSFGSANTPTYGKNNATLQSEGWITAEGVLAPEHDAAQVHWGGGWRMPTDSEFSELINNCDWTWTATNGVNGYVVRGKGDFAEASIFVPAAGYGYGTSLYDAGSRGDVWSGVPYSGNSDFAWYLGFLSGDRGVGIYYRNSGYSVRPVRGSAE